MADDSSLSDFPADVPLLPTIEYDFRGLDDFPMRHGITSSNLQELDYTSAEDAASLVQSWLFFGVLADLAGTLVDRQNILHLSAYRFPPIRQISEIDSGVASESEGRTWSRKLRDVVRIGIDNVERIDRLEIARAYPMPLVLLSIKILLCDLAAMKFLPTGRTLSHTLPAWFQLCIIICQSSRKFDDGQRLVSLSNPSHRLKLRLFYDALSINYGSKNF